MGNLEPKNIASIIVRPCYDSNGEVASTKTKKSLGNPRFIGELYVQGKRRWQTMDFDHEGSAYQAVVTAIQEQPRLLNLQTK